MFTEVWLYGNAVIFFFYAQLTELSGFLDDFNLSKVLDVKQYCESFEMVTCMVTRGMKKKQLCLNFELVCIHVVVVLCMVCS